MLFDGLMGGLSSMGTGLSESMSDGLLGSLVGDGTMAGSPLMGLGQLGIAGMGMQNAKQGQKDMSNLANMNQSMQMDAYSRDKERQDATSKLRF